MAQPKARPDFFSLPQEVRNRIYENLLSSKRQIIPYCRPAAQSTLTPSILRTCRQVGSEASTALYTKNTFLISNPTQESYWLTKIGRANIKRLKTLRIFPDAVYDSKGPWCQLLRLLAREATGLRHIYISWDYDETSSIHHGAGKDVRFARELAGIQDLRSMTINGYYGLHWPRFLTDRMNFRVREENDDESGLRKFQRGTEKLFL